MSPLCSRFWSQVGRTFQGAPIKLLCAGIMASAAVLADQAPSGTVVSEDGTALPNALVRLQGTAEQTTTDQDGHFEFSGNLPTTSKFVTSWKEGFYNGGALITESGRAYRIVLKRLPAGDDPAYTWIPPRQPAAGKQTANSKACADCHPPDAFPILAQWEKSSHAKAAVNPLFLEHFSGSNTTGPLIRGLGYKQDFPQSNGSCAACHVPAMALHDPYGSDPRQADGIEREGVFCDFCHKVEDVAIDGNGGHPGVLAMRLKRPAKDGGMFFGPFDDVYPGPDSFNPLFKQSRYCAGCHDGRFWNVAVYSEFKEWSESSYAKRNITCQNCHMKPDGKTSRFALAEKGSVRRDPATIASHAFTGIKDADFMRGAVAVAAEEEVAGNQLTLTVTITNKNAGHHIPTGSPLRNMVLLVEAVDAQGKLLKMTTGGTVPEWAGMGAPSQGNYAGMPGKGFAKILKSMGQYSAENRTSTLTHLYPAPFWRPVVVDYDNRIPADGMDRSAYVFAIPGEVVRPIHVTARLIYRRTFKSWLKPTASGTEDLVLASLSRMVR